MKRRNLALVMLVVVGLGLGWVLYQSRVGMHTHVSGGSVAAPEGQEPPQSSPKPATPQFLPAPTRPATMTERQWQALLDSKQELLARNGPVQFFARAVDQEGEPVTGAILELRLMRYDAVRMFTEGLRGGETTSEERIVLTSDSEGHFRLTGRSGCELDVEALSKTGYVWSSESHLHYNYMPQHMPPTAAYCDPKRGVVFHLWRKGKAERLVPVSYTVSLRRERTNAFVNLLTGLVRDKSNADLEFTMTMLSPGDAKRPYDRTYEIRGLGDTVLRLSEEPYGYLAPAEGYESAYKESYVISDPTRHFVSEWKRVLFVRARSSRLIAGLKVNFSSGSSRFEIHGFVNPSGSRVLEPDPSKLITDPDEIRRLDEATRVK